MSLHAKYKTMSIFSTMCKNISCTSIILF